MEKEKDVTLYDLERRLESALETMDEDYNIKERAIGHHIDLDEARGEVISEIVEGIIPIYNYDLLTVCGSRLELGYYEPDIDHGNIYDILREAIWRHLEEKAGDLLEAKKA